MPRRALCFSVDSPIAMFSKASVSPSWAIASSISIAPYLWPAREFGSRCGALVMDSWPPATTMSNSPARMSWSARAIASSPERHTLLTVSAGTLIGMPAFTAAWRAGICPAPAWSTWPMITYWTCSPPIPARSSAALIAKPPRSAPEKDLSEPRRRPIGVRAPATITDVVPWVPAVPDMTHSPYAVRVNEGLPQCTER
ncbi:hypothetical protein GA0115246_1039619 [Streptomyces sp. SolWspMP-sol7th]|nr:hypothetical protein GA0115246_1039619 [Streptomyces sp. SolWspMP-sol7th]